MLKWKRILAATDFSPLGDAAVATAASIARRAGGALAIVYVADPPPPFSQPLLTRIGPADPDELWTRQARRSMAVVRHFGGPVLVLPGSRIRARTKRLQGELAGEVNP